MWLIAGLLWTTLAAQTVPNLPVTRIREYLSLTEAQIEGLLVNTREQAQERAARLRRVDELRRALLAEMAREAVDAVALGSLAVDRETVCREDRRSYEGVSERARALLTPAQRTRLQELDGARRLEAAIQEAQMLALLDGNTFGSVAGLTPTLPGCASFTTGLIFSPGGVPSFAAKQYLNLTDAQYRVLSENTQSYAITLQPAQSRMGELNRSIALEITNEALDPVRLGSLYAELAGVCQSADGAYRELRRAAESILSEPQKTQLNLLRAAQDLLALVPEAQFLGLMPGATGATGGFAIAGAGRFAGVLQVGCSIP